MDAEYLASLPKMEVHVNNEYEIHKQLTLYGQATLICTTDEHQRRHSLATMFKEGLGRGLIGHFRSATAAGAMSGKTTLLDSLTGDALDMYGDAFDIERFDDSYGVPTSLGYSAPPTIPHLRWSGISLTTLEFLYAQEIKAERTARERVRRRLFPAFSHRPLRTLQ